MVIACTVAASSGRELRFLDSAPVVLALYQPWSTKVFAPSNEETHMIRFAQAQEAVTLKVHHFLPAGSYANTMFIQPWCDKIAKESANKLKCQIYPSMQLGGTPPQLFDQVRDGVADVIWTLPGYTAGRFPLPGGVRAAVHDAEPRGHQQGAVGLRPGSTTRPSSRTSSRWPSTCTATACSTCGASRSTPWPT
jgi:hypothetical protein